MTFRLIGGTGNRFQKAFLLGESCSAWDGRNKDCGGEDLCGSHLLQVIFSAISGDKYDIVKTAIKSL